MIDTEKINGSRICLILLVILGCYLFISSQASLWDRDEPRFSRATAEMLESGNYLYPTFNGKLRPDKPVLIYWLMSLPMRVLGQTEVACRFFSAVGVAVSCFFTYLIGRHYFDQRVGFWSVLILASSLLVMVEGTIATADGALLGAMTASIYFFLVKMQKGMGIGDGLLMGLFLGAALLLKGPVALLVVAVILCILLLNRKNIDTKAKNVALTTGAAIFAIALFLAWGLPANEATGGEFARMGIGKHVVGRSTVAMESHGGNFWAYLPYYIPVVLAGFFPWTLHFFGMLSAVLGGRLAGPLGRGVFLGWVVPIFTVMTLVATKLPHYILFIWPAMAIATAAAITSAQQGALHKRDVFWLRAGVWAYGAIAFVGVVGLAIVPWFLPFDLFIKGAAVAGLVLGLSAFLAIRYQLKNQFMQATQVLVSSMVIIQLPVLFWIVPAVEQTKISPNLAAAVKEVATDEMSIATYGYAEPSLNFYVARRLEHLSGEKDLVHWAKQAGSGILIASDEKLRRVENMKGSLGLRKMATQKGLNVAKGISAQEISVYGRGI